MALKAAAMHDRIFINHPRVGTVLLRKTRPLRGKQYRIVYDFVSRVASAEYPNWGSICFKECKVCGKALLNPQSILLHIGNECESKKPN